MHRPIVRFARQTRAILTLHLVLERLVRREAVNAVHKFLEIDPPGAIDIEHDVKHPLHEHGRRAGEPEALLELAARKREADNRRTGGYL